MLLLLAAGVIQVARSLAPRFKHGAWGFQPTCDEHGLAGNAVRLVHLARHLFQEFNFYKEAGLENGGSWLAELQYMVARHHYTRPACSWLRLVCGLPLAFDRF